MHTLKIGLAQISPIWLDKSLTLEKIESYINQAGEQQCELLVFGEALLPGYPFWLSFTNGSAFDNLMQKELYAHYVQHAIQIESSELESICKLAKQHQLAIYLGIIERAKNRGGHSLYCSLVFIDAGGVIRSVHRKLQPTFEERLVWATGDGNGLRVHPIKKFHVGGLNCWENWMPLARTALYAQGENIHVAVWPGSKRNTADITKFIAKESRSFAVSVSGLMRKEHIPKDIPHYETIIRNAPEVLANGGSCIAAPNGEWIVEPVVGKETLITATIKYQKVLEERQNFDPVGHYARPDVTKLTVDRTRQTIADFVD